MSRVLLKRKAALELSSYAFDAMWTAALALNKSIDDIDFITYKNMNRKVADLLMTNIKTLQFSGISVSGKACFCLNIVI